ncbi:LAETG motif-containing sortase-dependent surface protein [Streptomyces genisteinicus]|uniref:LPXTG cell wall anchor domain-containing protein n=1 Tax=Streptomyces genisteinicus TaxID=2768068 RepID=A0A7H0HMX3_9ACTN|nr:LAETG motif-containing sortase-dependent surface protein [Streptomyces genisteinicus]QNP61889.1 LPXTG cell wall anchor domain-containing protein [Streptomyces genisteinicus]
MTNNNRTLRRSAALVVAAAAGVLGLGLAAGPAVAHTPTWSVTCDEVDIKLTNYGRNTKNTVTVSVDGKELLPTETFENDFAKKLALPEHDKEVAVRLVVVAQDGDKYSRDETKTAPVCEEPPSPTPSPTPSTSEPTPTPTPTPTPSATPSGTPSDTPSSPASTPSPAPSTEAPDLAETGSSSSTPLIAGAAAVVIVAGGGIVWASRKRRGAQS